MLPRLNLRTGKASMTPSTPNSLLDKLQQIRLQLLPHKLTLIARILLIDFLRPIRSLMMLKIN